MEWNSFKNSAPAFGQMVVLRVPKGKVNEGWRYTVAQREDRSDDEAHCYPYQWKVPDGYDFIWHKLSDLRPVAWLPLEY